MRWRGLRRAAVVVLLAALLALVALLATGEISYAVTHGISMLPTFHTGDLVVLRAAGSYHLGEVVAYRSPLLHTTVLHRVVAERDGLFSFKGDNNHWLDPQKLPASAIIGTVLWHIPRGGLVLDWLREPLHVALTVVVVLALGALVEYRHRARRRSATPVPAVDRGPIHPILGWGLGLMVLAGAVTVLAYRSSLERPASAPVAYHEQVSFSYAGSAARGAVYPDGRVENGQPVYLRLVRELDVGARWHFSGAPAEVNGTISLAVVLRQPDGWSRTLVSTPEQPFVGSSASATVPVSLASAERILQQAASSTGVPSAGETLALRARVAWSGTVDGQPTSGVVTPSFALELDALELFVEPGADGPTSQTSTMNGQVARQVLVPRTVRLFGRAIALRSIREGGLALGALGALAFLVGLLLTFRDRRDETARLLRRVRNDLVPVLTDPRVSGHPVIEVVGLDVLIELATRHEAPLLEHAEGDGHGYYAEIGGILYRFPIPMPIATPVAAADDVAALITLPPRNEAVAAEVSDPVGDDVAPVVSLGAPSLRVVASEPAQEADEEGMGLNAWFVEEQRRAYERDPLSVSASWRAFFEDGARTVAPSGTEATGSVRTGARR